jgi:4-hydroxybutyryl-CoA dehydratase/vinylacetyl-CoA-Delta-isomerase
MPQRSREDLFRLREVVKLWARVCFGKPPGAKFVAKDGLNSVTVVSKDHKKYGTRYAQMSMPTETFAEERLALRG